MSNEDYVNRVFQLPVSGVQLKDLGKYESVDSQFFVKFVKFCGIESVLVFRCFRFSQNCETYVMEKGRFIGYMDQWMDVREHQQIFSFSVLNGAYELMSGCKTCDGNDISLVVDVPDRNFWEYVKTLSVGVQKDVVTSFIRNVAMEQFKAFGALKEAYAVFGKVSRVFRIESKTFSIVFTINGEREIDSYGMIEYFRETDERFISAMKSKEVVNLRPQVDFSERHFCHVFRVA